MKILFVANGDEKANGRFFYSPDRKIAHGMIQNGHHVWFFSDRDIARNSTFFKTRKLGVKKCNERFILTFKNLIPDLVVLGNSKIITNSSLEEVRKIHPSVRIIQFNVDAIFNKNNALKILDRAPHVDASFVTTAGKSLKQFDTERSTTYFIPNPVDPSIESTANYLRDELKNDVFCAMRRARKPIPESPRHIIPTRILHELPDLRPSFHGFNNAGELYGAAYFKTLSECKMGLNLSQTFSTESLEPANKEDLYLYSSDRISHYMGCGLLTFIDSIFGYQDLFTDQEMVFYDSYDELIDKIKFYASNNTQLRNIAKNGSERYHALMNNQIVARYMIERTFKSKLQHAYHWVT